MNLESSDYLAVTDSKDIDYLADVVLERNPDLKQYPVDIITLAKRYASVEFASWDIDIDGIAEGLTGSKPRIYIREVPSNFQRRQRFTLAHELGHVLIPWHSSQVVCSLSDNHFVIKPYYEPEANSFASRLLMPPSNVHVLAKRHKKLDDFFSVCDGYELSPEATVIALTQLLVPGFVFRFWSQNVIEYSSDPNLVLPAVQLDRESQLESYSLAHGVFKISGKDVSWYFLGDREFQWQSTDSITDRSSVILRNLLEDMGRESSFSSVNGTVSGLLGKLRTHRHELLYSHLNLRLQFDERFPDELRKREDFQLYLRKIIAERVEKDSAKRG